MKDVNNSMRSLPNWDGFLTDMSGSFDTGVTELNARLTEALEKLQANPSDPQNLAAYQAVLSEYTLYRNAQSNVVKTYKDVAAAIVANYR